MRVVVEQGSLPHYRVPFFEALGHQVETLTVVHSGTPAATNASFREVVLPLRAAQGIYLQPGLKRAVEDAEPEVLVVMFDLRWPMNILETAVARKARRRLLWGHGLGRHRSLWPLRLAWIRRVDGVILYHRAQADQLIELGVPEEKVFVAPNTVALPSASTVSQRRNSVLFVGRLQPRKRIDILIDAFSRLRAQGDCPDVSLDLVGEGTERPALEDRVRRLGLQTHVRFHGRVIDPTRLAHLFGRAIAYASPGATGLSLLHAFAHGVPAVIGAGSDHGPEVQDLIPGVNGLQVATNAEDFCKGLRAIVSDAGLRNRLGCAAEAFMRRERRLEHMVDGFTEALMTSE